MNISQAEMRRMAGPPIWGPGWWAATGLLVAGILGAVIWPLPAFIIFAVGLLFSLRFRREDGRGGWVLLFVNALLFIVLSSGLYLALSRLYWLLPTNPWETNTPEQLWIITLLAGLLLSIVLVWSGFALAVLGQSWIIQRQEPVNTVPLRRLFPWLARHILQGRGWRVTVNERGELIGREEDRQRLAEWGGPGLLTVYAGNVVVLQRHGRIERVVGMGLHLLERAETVRVIFPLGNRGMSLRVEHVLTRDRIPLTVELFYLVRLQRIPETDKAAADTSTSIQQLTNGMTTPTGDDVLTCYEGIVLRAAREAAGGLAESLRNASQSILRDIFMTIELEELFALPEQGTEEENNWDTRLNSRRLHAIEQELRNRLTPIAHTNGLTLVLVDISTIHFPESLQERIIQEAEARIEARIQTTAAEAALKAASLQSDDDLQRADTSRKVAHHQAKTIEIMAHAAMSYYSTLIRGLRQENIDEETIHEVIKRMVHGSLHDETRNLLASATHFLDNYPPSSRQVE